jgi:hypothetical protein
MFLVPNIYEKYKEMKKIKTGNRFLINPFQLNAYQKVSIVEIFETETDFVDLLFFWHNKCWGRRQSKKLGN